MKKTALVVLLLLVVAYVATDRFLMPSYTRQGESMPVPDVSGKNFDDAMRLLKASGLAGKKDYNIRYLKNVEPDRVLSQRPAAGTEVKPGRTVYLVVNKREKPAVTIPDFYGKPLDEVRETLQRFDVGLRNVEEQEVFDPGEDGKVLSQSIAPNSVVSTGASISVIVGKMAEIEVVSKDPVPDVLGMSLSQARSLIVERGFNTGNVYYEYSALLVPNTVISQKPAVNSLAEPGQVVDLTVVTDQE